jgi:hypothetical protein
MYPATRLLVWLFPAVFLVHDLEELLLWEPWLERNREDILRRVPPFLAGRVRRVLGKSRVEAAVPVAMIFGLTVLASLLAAGYGLPGLFLLASGMFFVHGFLHLGQALLLRRYVPAVVTSAGVVIPYGLVLFTRLIHDGIVTYSGLTVVFMATGILMVPFILGMHWAGDLAFRWVVGRRGPEDGHSG